MNGLSCLMMKEKKKNQTLENVLFFLLLIIKNMNMETAAYPNTLRWPTNTIKYRKKKKTLFAQNIKKKCISSIQNPSQILYSAYQ